MTGWAGFWLMLGIIEAANIWRRVKKKEIQCKNPNIKFKWYE